MTFHPISPFSRQNFGFKANLFSLYYRWPTFLFAHTLKLYFSLYITVLEQVSQRFFIFRLKYVITFIFPINSLKTLKTCWWPSAVVFYLVGLLSLWHIPHFHFQFYWKTVPFAYLFKSNILSLNGPEPLFVLLIWFTPYKDKITKNTALLTETSNRPEPS